MAENAGRDFIKRSALGTAAMLVYPPSRVLGANDRARVGMIGVGGWCAAIYELRQWSYSARSLKE